MSELNGYDIDKAMESMYRYPWESLDYYIKQYGDEVELNGKTYKVKFIEFNGGDDDYSSQMHVIFQFGDKTYKKRGYYQSHYGSEWDGAITEVVPKTVTVIEWEDV